MTGYSKAAGPPCHARRVRRRVAAARAASSIAPQAGGSGLGPAATASATDIGKNGTYGPETELAEEDIPSLGRTRPLTFGVAEHRVDAPGQRSVIERLDHATVSQAGKRRTSVASTGIPMARASVSFAGIW